MSAVTEKARLEAAHLMLQGRFGRAIRVYARACGRSPRLFKDSAARLQWAKDVIAGRRTAE